MLPTSYRGAATIDGEAMPAELHLDAGRLELRLANGREVLRWPIADTDVATIRHGDYRLSKGEEIFEFAPVVDDGLGDEIALRRRFASNGSTLPTFVDAGNTTAPAPTVAHRVAEAGRAPTRRAGVIEGRDLGLRTALVVLGVLAVAVLSVAVVSGALQERPATVVVGTDATPTAGPDITSAPATAPTPTTIPTTPTTVAAAPRTALPATTTTLTPPTVAPATITTQTTVPPPASVFEMSPEQLVSAWDGIAAPIDTALIAGDLATTDSIYEFRVSDYVEMQGPLSNGRVDRVRFLGDPSGPQFEDRRVLTALGITLAIVEPSLPPSGRRQLLEALGLDVENPTLEDLDESFVYAGKDYLLRWDGERLVFEVGREGSLLPVDGDS